MKKRKRRAAVTGERVTCPECGMKVRCKPGTEGRTKTVAHMVRALSGGQREVAYEEDLDGGKHAWCRGSLAYPLPGGETLPPLKDELK